LFDKSQATLLQYPNRKAGDYVIPGSVKTIGGSSFGSCSGLAGVVIPDNVTYIGTNAFNFSSVTNVSIGNGVRSIEDYAFFQCLLLTKVSMGDGVTNIGSHAFMQTALLEFTMGNGVIRIGDLAFYASTLPNITIPDSVVSIESYAFEFDSVMTNLTIGSHVTNWGAWVAAVC
jgi:hypothetical protein